MFGPSLKKSDIINAISEVYDPEIPVNIYDLGLIYTIDFNKSIVIINMTLTSPGCPVAGELPIMVKEAVKKVKGVHDVQVNIIWDPPWTPDLMTESARLSLNLF
jgi:FeS assembly SUF system protein